MPLTSRRTLGRSVQLTALLQLALYALVTADVGSVSAFFDPRLALAAVAEPIVGGPVGYPPAVSWVSVVTLLVLGEAVARSRAGLIVYAIVEGTYALLFLSLSALVVAAGLPPSHGLSPRELVAPFVLFVVASAAPLAVAVRLWLREPAATA
jgi:hypothetical protein